MPAPRGPGRAAPRPGPRCARAPRRQPLLHLRRERKRRDRLRAASPRDARRLILLMAGFGVPAEFPLQEFYELLLAGGCLTCVEVLRCSQLFMKKLHDVVADMLNRGSYRGHTDLHR